MSIAGNRHFDFRFENTRFFERFIFSRCFVGNMYLGICDYEIKMEVNEADMDSVLMV